MGTFDNTKCLNVQGTLKESTQTDIIDMWGTIFGSPQFDSAKVIDFFGNLGALGASGPWEMQLGTIETVGSDQGTISANFVANAAAPTLSTFLSLGCTGYLTGIVSGSGVWTIQSGNQTIGGISYAGAGLLISSGANTHSGTINMQSGSNLQLGANCNNVTTRALGNLTIATGATATQMTAYTVNTFLSQALTNSGTYNVVGCGTCGVGGLGLATTVSNNGIINIDKAMWRNQSTWSGTGTVNVKSGGTFQLSTNAIGSTTQININGFGWSGLISSVCTELGALHCTGATSTIAAKINVQTASSIKEAVNCNTTFTGVLSGTAPLTVGTLGTPINGITHFSNTANTYSGVMTIDGTNLNASYGNSLQFAKIKLANGGRLSSSATQTIGSLQSSSSTAYWVMNDFTNHYIKSNGITTYDGKLLWGGGSNTANVFLEGGAGNQLTITSTGNTANLYPRGGAKLIMQGATFTGTNGQVRVSTGGVVSAGTSTTASCTYLSFNDSASRLEVRAVGSGVGCINVTTNGVATAAGWKVDLPDVMVEGVYTIIKNTGPHSATVPVIGTNLSERTATFAWNTLTNPKTLTMTLI
jgi:hypothetical protein